MRPQLFVLAALPAVTAACGSSSRGAPAGLPPAIITAAVAAAGPTPVAGELLLLTFSKDVALAPGTLFDDADVVLSDGASLGAVAAPPSLLTANTIAVPLGIGVALTPGATTIALGPGNDAVRDTAGRLGTGGAPVTIGQSDGQAPVVTSITVAAIDAALNGTGPAGGLLQVPSNGWTIDLRYADNGAIATGLTRITASLALATPSGAQPPGTDLAPLLTALAVTQTEASYLVPANVAFANGPLTLQAIVVDASGLASTPATFQVIARAFPEALRPFRTTVHPQQLWYLDFARDLESYTTSAIAGGASVGVTPGANGQSDFEELVRILGLTSATPLIDLNAQVLERIKSRIVAELDGLYAGANVAFTTTFPGGSFGTGASLPYNSFPYSLISIAGAASTAGVLGVAIFDPSNATQNNNTLSNLQGTRLGVFLHTIVNSGLGPPASSAFRLTFSPFAPVLGGTPIGNSAQDGDRLAGTLNDARRVDIDIAIADFARFTAVVTAHECGHSMGLVQNGAMPIGLYGNDPVNFPGSIDGHIRNTALFPAGATNVMTPALSFSAAINPATAFNSLNLAYLREQAFYGN